MASLREKLREMRKERKIKKWLFAHLKFPVGWLAMFIMMMLRPLTFLHRFLPKKARMMMQSWDLEMFRMFVFSFGRYAYIDQRATVKNPPTWEPLIKACRPDLQLTADDIKTFYDKGFLGPFTLCSREEILEMREKVQQEIETVSKIYDFPTGRDRHLDCPNLWNLIHRPELYERLAQLLGPNLLLWRSQVFLKPPGAPEITWHQAVSYLSEEQIRCTLYPRDKDELFQLTTWLAFDDVDLENGCMQFAPGTHRNVYPVRIGGEEAEGFAKARVKLVFPLKEDEVVNMEMKAGQFVIFTERCIHGSPPNRSKDRRRWGMAFRNVKPDTLVYGKDETVHRVNYLEQNFKLDKWGVVEFRGHDTAKINRHCPQFYKLDDQGRAIIEEHDTNGHDGNGQDNGVLEKAAAAMLGTYS
jgi:non-heme Fe2+,alpha-ketoglutarate-dependent halogenase